MQRLRKDSVIASHEGHGKATLWLARIRGAECGQKKAEKAVQGLLERERRQVRVQAGRVMRRRATMDQYERFWPRRPTDASGKGRKHLHPYMVHGPLTERACHARCVACWATDAFFIFRPPPPAKGRTPT